MCLSKIIPLSLDFAGTSFPARRAIVRYFLLCAFGECGGARDSINDTSLLLCLVSFRRRRRRRRRLFLAFSRRSLSNVCCTPPRRNVNIGGKYPFLSDTRESRSLADKTPRWLSEVSFGCVSLDENIEGRRGNDTYDGGLATHINYRRVRLMCVCVYSIRTCARVQRIRER